MTASTLMIQGTSSSVGKSLLVAGLCRVFARRGLRVAPFKAQNMSNNAAVCDDGAEIGRSQALQALAAGVAPEAAMNPVLLKPEADARSQVIVNGRPWKTVSARDYYRTRDDLWPVVTRALDELRARHDLVVIEGAGSAAELNLCQHEIVNMAIARYAGSPVLLAGDIDRGGIFAQLLGTLWLLEPDDRALVRGLIVNKFRGDPALFSEGVRILEEKGGLPVLGVVPWLHDLNLPEEDSVALESARSVAPAWRSRPDAQRSEPAGVGQKEPIGPAAVVESPASGSHNPARGEELDIAVIHFPRISNFDDFDPLRREPLVRLRYVRSSAELGRPHVVILPGTKSTMADLMWLHETGLAREIRQRVSEGATVAGICGGYQMLGERLRDPDGVESAQTEMPGLGLLPIETAFVGEKTTRRVQATIDDDRHCCGCRGETVSGYEIHMGRSVPTAVGGSNGDGVGPSGWLRIHGREGFEEGTVSELDGAVSSDTCVWGCYLHGLFDNDTFRRSWLRHVSDALTGSPVAEIEATSPIIEPVDWRRQVEASLNRLADSLEASLDLKRLERIADREKAVPVAR